MPPHTRELWVPDATLDVCDFYGRKSNRDDGQSIAGQEDDWREDCQRERWTPGRSFADPDRSASRFGTKPREDYKALLAYLRSGQCTRLALWEASRGTRRVGEWADFLDLCREHGVLIRIISHHRTYNVRLRRDWRTLIDEGVEAADESEKISERVTRGHRQSALRGRPVGMIPYGWVRVHDASGKHVTHQHHPDQGPIVIDIVKRILDGESLVSIARDLNRRGVPAPRGGLWSDSQVRNVASRQTHAGVRTYHGEPMVEQAWDPLVDPATHQQLRELLADPARKKFKDVDLTHWLVGAVICGQCSATFRSSVASRGRMRYVCRGCARLAAYGDVLESAVEAAILGRMSAPDARAALTAPPRRENAEITALWARIRRLEEHVDNIALQAANPDSGVSLGMATRVEAATNAQIAEARALLAKLEAPRRRPPTLPTSVDVVRDWAAMSATGRRTVVLALAEVVLGPSRRGGRGFDLWRLAESRWHGDDRTWGDRWREGGVAF